jgi:hypothetical protein
VCHTRESLPYLEWHPDLFFTRLWNCNWHCHGCWYDFEPPTTLSRIPLLPRGFCWTLFH